MIAKHKSATLIVCAIVCLCTRFAGADLQIDLRATAVNGVPISGAQTPHLIPNALAGDVIWFDIRAVVTGANGSLVDDRILISHSSLRSSPAGGAPLMLGDLDADVVRTTFDQNGDPTFIGFDGPGFSVGNRADLDGDGDIDVGTNDPSSSPGHFAVHYNASTGQGGFAGVPDGARIGFGTFTISSADNGAQTLINSFGRDALTAALYRQDGTLIQSPTFDAPPENGILVTAVPEPMMLSPVVAISACCALRRRGRAS